MSARKPKEKCHVFWLENSIFELQTKKYVAFKIFEFQEQLINF